jgi:hypothetical protein
VADLEILVQCKLPNQIHDSRPDPALPPDQFSWLPPPYEYEFKHLPIDIITGDEAIRKGLEGGRDLDETEAGWQ